jgi:hypothetical protein
MTKSTTMSETRMTPAMMTTHGDTMPTTTTACEAHEMAFTQLPWWWRLYFWISRGILRPAFLFPTR